MSVRLVWPRGLRIHVVSARMLVRACMASFCVFVSFFFAVNF